MKTIYLTTIILSALLLYNGCDTTEPPPTPPNPEIQDTVTINVTQTTHRSITLNVQTTAHHQNRTVELYRSLNQNDTLTAAFLLTVKDTTIIDDNNGEGLTIDTEYDYFAVTLDSTNTPQDTTEKLTAKTLAPTSHDYEWKEFTIGQWQSSLYDVWGTDEDNVYAVGRIRIEGETYGILHYDGTSWTPVDEGGGYAIYGFSEDDIWAVGGGVFHYDGNEWKEKAFTVDESGSVITLDPVLKENTPYTSLWGTSSENLYLGSHWGKIIHWDGEEGTVMDIKTEKVFQDIWGFSEDNIYAVSSRTFADEPDKLFHYNGLNWKVLKTGDTFPMEDELKSPFMTVWGVNETNFYVCGGSVNQKLGNTWIDRGNPLGRNMERIRGSQSNNIFVVGHYATIAHYNGVDWKNYDQFFDNETVIHSVAVLENKVFAVGRNASYAKIYIGNK